MRVGRELSFKKKSAKFAVNGCQPATSTTTIQQPHKANEYEFCERNTLRVQKEKQASNTIRTQKMPRYLGIDYLAEVSFSTVFLPSKN